MRYNFLVIGIVMLVSFGLNAQIKVYCFGHSLIDHAPSTTNTDPNTNILHWMNDMSSTANYSFKAGGQYGFLTGGLGHDNLPPSADWGWVGIDPVWDEGNGETFAQADINTILITAGNFIQYQPPNQSHPLNANSTAIQATETIFDWVNSQEPSGVRYYIYGNWPEMDLANGFPPSSTEISDFHNATMSGEFPDWWINYQDGMLSSHPNTKLIPVGLIISKLLTDPNLGLASIPFGDLYQDSSPHGRTSLYYLAGMITYMALYEEDIPASYDPGSSVLSEIRNNLGSIRNFIWTELNNFNFPNGDSRVFFGPLPVTWLEPLNVRPSGENALLTWTLSQQINNEKIIIEHSADDAHFYEIHSVKGDGTLAENKSYQFLHKKPESMNYYRIKQIDSDGSYSYSNIVSFKKNQTNTQVFPNPTTNYFSITSWQKSYANIYNHLGQVVKTVNLKKGKTSIDISELLPGIYYIKTDLGESFKLVRK